MAGDILTFVRGLWVLFCIGVMLWSMEQPAAKGFLYFTLGFFGMFAVGLTASW